MKKRLRRRKARSITRKLLRRHRRGEQKVSLETSAPRWYFINDSIASRSDRLGKMERLIENALCDTTGCPCFVAVVSLGGDRICITSLVESPAPASLDFLSTHPAQP